MLLLRRFPLRFQWFAEVGNELNDPRQRLSSSGYERILPISATPPGSLKWQTRALENNRPECSRSASFRC